MKKLEKISKICHYCGKEFTLHRKNFSGSTQKSNTWKNRIHCNQSCAVKANLKNAPDLENPWTDAEIDYLNYLIGKEPDSLLGATNQ